MRWAWGGTRTDQTLSDVTEQDRNHHARRQVCLCARQLAEPGRSRLGFSAHGLQGERHHPLSVSPHRGWGSLFGVDDAIEAVRPAATAKSVTLKQTIDPNAGPILSAP